MQWAGLGHVLLTSFPELRHSSPGSATEVDLRNRGPLAKHKRERGQSTVEFVLVLPLLLMFLFLIVDFGWLLKNWIVVTNTAREVTRCEVVRACSLNGAPVAYDLLAQDRITAGVMTNLAGTPEVVRSYIDENGDGKITAGDSILICIKALNKYISPVLPMFSFVTGGGTIPNPMPLEAREQMRLELSPAGTPAVGDGKCHF